MFRREQPPERLVDYSRRVEAAGVDELWIVEDCFYHGGIAQAATALAVTERITVGIGIVPAVARNAAFLAMELATLARMHPGRVHGGIGHGVADWMEQIGARPASWLASLAETTDAVRSILRGERVTTEGRYVRLRDVELEYPPASPASVSLGVRGAKSLALSGRHADGTVLAEASAPVYVRWARERIEEGRRDRHAPPDHRLTVYALCDVNSTDPGTARAGVRHALAEFLGDGSAMAQTAPLPYVTELNALIADGGAAALESRMPDAWVDDLAISGSPEQCVAAVARLRAAGAASVVLVPPPALDPDAWLDRVAESFLPELRG
jgi:alkanesulfonate monooxygenase SsuD/methylene tetrahydromethanopterin reductase-like flavin-dependent oxidoreductase (luciferase family)